MCECLVVDIDLYTVLGVFYFLRQPKRKKNTKIHTVESRRKNENIKLTKRKMGKIYIPYFWLVAVLVLLAYGSILCIPLVSQIIVKMISCEMAFPNYANPNKKLTNEDNLIIYYSCISLLGSFFRMKSELLK